jgi:hypothetical protein
MYDASQMTLTIVRIIDMTPSCCTGGSLRSLTSAASS